MSKYYCSQLEDEGMVVLGFVADDGTSQEALISLRHGANLCRYTYQRYTIIDYEPDLLNADEFTGTLVLYPTPNRVENGVFNYRGKSFEQVKRGKRVFEHGLVYDEEWELVDLHASGNESVLSARILWDEQNLMFSAFPFPHSLTLTFCLTDGKIAITYDIFNFGSKELPYGFGLHPYFQKLSGEENTKIKIPVRYVMEATEELLPTGKIQEVAGTKFDLNQNVSIGSLDLDHVYIKKTGDVPASIFYQDLGFSVDIYATDDFSYYVLYSPPGEAYFCLENQTCSTDAHNLYDRGLQDVSGLKFVVSGDHQMGTVRYVIS